LKLLLDTHIWIWAVLDPSRLSAQVLRALRDPKSERWLSSFSVWEALVLHSKGRLWLSDDAVAWVARASSALSEAPLTSQIVTAAYELQFAHKDPADRFLAATAQVLGLTLVTADQRLLGLGTIATLANH
jgi:PIN domain nuclease of toxin-antitoxin system